VQIYAGLREQELRAAAAQYFEEFIHSHIFPELASLIATLRQGNVELWAVSSTNRWVIAEGVRDLGIPPERVLAAEVRVLDGVITSEILDVPTDAAKAAALARAGITSPDAVFGNSIHDLAMLEIARRPFPVNPSPALLEAAGKRNWGYFRPQSVENVAPPTDKK
jgi:phosphoserine phosphatase